jgi:ligand-binding sensor domain-containing protein
VIFLLALFCGAASALETERFPSYAHVLAIEVRGESAVVATSGGAYRLGLSTGWPVAPVDSGPRGKAAPVGFEPVLGFPVTALARSGGMGYAGTFGGGLRLLPSGRRVEGVPSVVTALAPAAGGLLCGTERGLYFVSGSSAVPVGPRGLPDENVNVLAVGRDELWVGHFDGGVSRLSRGEWRHWGLEDGLPSEWVDDLVLEGGRLWGATEKGVFWIEGGTVTRPSQPALNEPSAALFVSSGAVYVAQPGKILVWRSGVLSALDVPEKHPQRLWVEGPVVWLAGLEGLYRVENGKVERQDVLSGSLPGNWITAVTGWRGGLLIGTYDAGLAALGERTVALKPDAWVNVGALAVSGGRVAVGGREEGLHVLADGVWRRYGAADGLPGDDVSAVAFDGDALWVGTRSGLAKVKF